MRILSIICIAMLTQSIAKAQQVNVLLDTGKVGVGTLTPRSALEIYSLKSFLSIGSVTPTEVMADNEVIGGINFYKHYALANGASIKMLHAGGPNNYSMTHLAFYTANGGNPHSTVPDERMRITSTGEVAIGTIDPKGYKLAVGGSMIAESVKVKLQGAWPDFVFSKKYQLPSLQETEKHILANGHLPGIPSASEVSKEGIDLGEMNKKLLQKIEELTLYLIEMKKENDLQKKDVDYLKSKIK